MTTPATPTSPTAPTLQLEDIHLPDPISFWPLAPGWWLLLILLLLLAVAAVYLYQHGVTHWFYKRRLKQQLISELEECYQEWQQHQQSDVLCASLNAQLKRYCRRWEPQALSLSGEAWVDWLETRGGEPFSAAHRHALAHGPYQPDSGLSEQAIRALSDRCIDWAQQATLCPTPEGDSH